jgi:hypothetical protein
MTKTVSTRYIAAAVHLVLMGHPVERVEPNPNQRGQLVFYFGENAASDFREYQAALHDMRDKAYHDLRELGWA